MNFTDAKNLRIVTGYLEDHAAYQFSQQLAAVGSAPRLGDTSPGSTRKMASDGGYFMENPTINGGFNWKIHYKWAIFHGYVGF